MHRLTIGEPCSNQKRLLADCKLLKVTRRQVAAFHVVDLLYVHISIPTSLIWSAYCWSSGSNASHRPWGANQNDSLGANLCQRAHMTNCLSNLWGLQDFCMKAVPQFGKKYACIFGFAQVFSNVLVIWFWLMPWLV